MVINSVWELLADKFQIGLDIFTALSVIIAAWQYIRNNKQQAEQLRQQRLAESGGQVLTEHINKLSNSYMRFVSEAVDVRNKLNFMRANEEIRDESALELFAARCTSYFRSSEKIEELNEEMEQFRRAYNSQIDLLHAQRYSIAPVLDAMSEKGENYLSQEVRKYCAISLQLYEELANFPYLFKELLDTLSKIDSLDDEIDYKALMKDEYLDIHRRLYSIVEDNSYFDYLKQDLYTYDELKDQVGDDPNLRIAMNMNLLFNICRDDKRLSALLNDISEVTIRKIQESTKNVKEMLCLYSACYSYIFNTENTSLDKEIEYYRNFFALGKEFR